MTLEDLDRQQSYQTLVNHIYTDADFDFVGVALQASEAPHAIKWFFVAGNQNEQFRKIVLRSGIGIAGLVVRTGKPFWQNDLDRYQYSDALYTPIANVESLKSAAAIPILTPDTFMVNGVLLAGYRSERTVSHTTISRLSQYLTAF
ncbi:NreA [Secundilactobacillus paracollinoides]|uniref:NreA n=1 Tax=Secundilactobacillus paracollinoides TaxID=240427 RepID=A0A1B2IVI5_9LACO|nr:NreA [Secundilactobacillus paracollinoides]ANZ62767.1 NreA [Secundilactobacillus paracollinoides]ANZ66074.1 NreA [Secundilactobacillus paracollinoides]